MERLIPRLEQHLALKLKLLPQFWQLLNLLQVPITELKEKLEEEFEENPLLEIEEEKDPDIPDEEKFEFQEDNIWEKRSEKFGQEDIKKREYLESLVTKPETLQEHLLKQLHIQKMTIEELLIGEEMIGNLNSNGYLEITLPEIAEKLKVSNRKCEKVLKIVQDFEPAGIGARDIKECLTIQLARKGLKEKIFQEIIERFLEELATHNYKRIERELQITDKKMEEFLQILKSLDPKPGRNYSSIFPSYAIPELFLDITPDGKYNLKINKRDIPKIRINKQYLKILKDPLTPQETKKYLKEKLKTTKELIQAMEQRGNTIIKITDFIINYQKDFFKKGKAGLKPLTLNRVSDNTGLDESTISRTVNGKYIDTPSGIFELRDFFSSNVRGVSSELIKEKIKDVVVAEDSKKPLSDNKIVQLLKEDGVNVARRTVAKYREELKILSTKLRRG